MAPQASKQTAKNYAARDWREKHTAKFRVRSSENSGPRTQNQELQIGSCTSNGIDWEQVPGTCSMLTMSSPSSQASAQSEKKVPDTIFIPVLTEWEFIYGRAEVI